MRDVDLEKDPDQMNNLFIESGYKVSPGYENMLEDLLKQLRYLREF